MRRTMGRLAQSAIWGKQNNSCFPPPGRGAIDSEKRSHVSSNDGPPLEYQGRRRGVGANSANCKDGRRGASFPKSKRMKITVWVEDLGETPKLTWVMRASPRSNSMFVW